MPELAPLASVFFATPSRSLSKPNARVPIVPSMPIKVRDGVAFRWANAAWPLSKVAAITSRLPAVWYFLYDFIAVLFVFVGSKLAGIELPSVSAKLELEKSGIPTYLRVFLMPNLGKKESVETHPFATGANTTHRHYPFRRSVRALSCR